jgi:hypothetical protein
MDIHRWRQAGAAVRSAKPRIGSQPTVIAAVAFCGLSMLFFGLWGFFAPSSFSSFIDYQPYNEHLVHDAGVFQIAIGVTTLLAPVWSDTVLLALVGFVLASGLHTLSHYLDRNIGGHDSDVPMLGLVTLVGVYAIGARLRKGVSRPDRT